MRLTKFIFGVAGLVKLEESERKSLAEWCFLLSALVMASLLFWHQPGVAVKIVMLLVWAALVIRATYLANETWREQKQRSSAR